jgi:3-deoxy-D-manno-octulosonic-acid transferase
VLETPRSYRLLATLANRLLPLATPWSAKLAVGDRERRRAVARWQQWARGHRDRARPLLWVHAPSVGEGLQANEVLRILRERHPEWQIVYSFFSPSAALLASRQPVDHADYLPYDTRANAEALLTALAPRAVVFTKLDLWPELATSARRTDAEVGMIAATVSPVSGRLNPLVRPLTAAGYRAISRAGAIDGPDADRLASLGTDPEVITITGDPRFDSADRRAREAAADPSLGHLTAGGGTMVAGSTWPADEAVLLRALVIVRRRHPDASLVLVPHEPTPRHLARLERRAAQLGLPITRLSTLGPGATTPLVIVDQVGVLAGLYAGAAMAYVGGGFGAAGLHSVLEPAACGVPTAFGPRWRSSREAGLLLAARAAVQIGARQADRAAEELADRWIDWLDHPAERVAQGRRAAAVVSNELGAAERNAELVERMMTA